jgi:hypothetical protein
MVCYVLMQVGKNQQQFQHSVTLLGSPHSPLVVQIIDNRKRIGEQPLKPKCINRLASAATLQGLIGSDKRLIQEMIKAQLFRDKARGIELAQEILRQLPGSEALITHPIA